MLSDEAISNLKRAGEIAKRAVEFARKTVKPGKPLFELADAIEKYIRELGGEPAFPVNIGINQVAAHYTPQLGDYSVVPDNSVVKVDIGVHLDGYIADTAITIAFNPVHESLVEAARKALEKALDVVRPGVKASDIGKVIEDTIKSTGFKPVKNLSGHGIDRFNIHSGVVIPNHHDVFCRHKLEEGIYAIEPFATNGIGLVKELEITTIYSLRRGCRAMPSHVKSFYEAVYGERRELPFTTRWYAHSNEELAKIRETLNHLKAAKCLVEYPVLVERGSGLVSQFEHTIVITGKDVLVITGEF